MCNRIKNLKVQRQRDEEEEYTEQKLNNKGAGGINGNCADESKDESQFGQSSNNNTVENKQ